MSRLFIPHNINTADESVRSRFGLLAGWVSIVVNLILFAVKIALGFISGSISLIADAFHTASDAITSVVVVASFDISRRPPDDRHPYGHGRAEYIGGLILAMLLIIIGIEFFRTSFHRLLVPRKLNVTYITIVAVSLTIIVKELMARFSNVIAKLINSDSLRADSWHHRSDAISSLFVIVAIVGGKFGINRLDGAMGIAVAAIMAVVGIKVFKNAANTLIGARPSRELLEEIFSAGMSVNGVLSVHDISVHSYGSTKMISLHAQVAQSVAPLEAHRIAEEIEHTINSKLESVHTVVHIDPVDLSRRIILEITEEINSFKSENPEVLAFHDLRVSAERNGKIIDLDLATGKGTPRDVVEKLKSRLSTRLAEKFPGYKVNIDVDPDFFYQKPK